MWLVRRLRCMMRGRGRSETSSGEHDALDAEADGFTQGPGEPAAPRRGAATMHLASPFATAALS